MKNLDFIDFINVAFG